ncbi:unnamed protein product [Mytilus edulis]|uniref:THAP-type domain-containing protein n=1 Tax=Mytilus edulis TaxID=6550 RepID=A0A8S3SCY2_MYTED|nr:unnamed protein product [Mytilus edulis]
MPRGDHGGKSSGSGTRCVAANCGNTHKDGYSLHTFPKDPSLSRQWVDFVKVKRAVWSGPTEYSAICSNHFTMDCFPFRVRFELEHFGRKPKKVQLNCNAIPSVHAAPEQLPLPLAVTPKSKNSSKEKRKASTNKSATSTSASPTVTNTTPTATKARAMPFPLEMLSPSEDAVCQSSPPKKVRRGYAKRETARLIAEHVHKTAGNTSSAAVVDSSKEDGVDAHVVEETTESLCVEEATEFVLEEHGPRTKTKGTQYNCKPKRRSMFCQTNLSTKKKPVNTERKNMVNKGTQTDYIQNAASLMSHAKPPMTDDYCWVRPEHIDQEMVKPLLKSKKRVSNSSADHEPLSSPFKDSDVLDPTFEPSSSDMSENEQDMENGNHRRNLPAAEMTKYIVFEANLLELFDRCKKSIGHVWFNYQQDYVHDVIQSGRSVVLGGDGRCDTPGHCAKYGSYNMIDLDEGTVADIQLVQSNEVPNSHHMEKAGLERSIEFFRHHNIPIKTIITDGHKMIAKWIREQMPETTHHLDVWHVAKGLKKKLAKLSLEKDCKDLQPWIKSIVNHLYWTAASSTGQDQVVIVAKWYSILNHIINVHDGHGEEFPACQHGPLEGRERHKKWLKPGTKVYEKLQGIVCHWQMKKNIVMLSPGKQTSALEGYHSVINHFAPKMIGFSYHGMLCRLWLAALHFNENNQREQAVTKDGRARYKIVYPKFKKGDYSVKRILVDCTYDYVQTVMTTVMGLGKVSHMNEHGVKLLVEVPPPLCSEYERPDKEIAVQNLMSRFNIAVTSHCQPDGNQCSSGQGMSS